MPASNDHRISVQVACPHGVYPTGARRFVLRQFRPSGGHIETVFQADRDLTLTAAVWQVEGRAPFPHEIERKWWELRREYTPAFAMVGERFKGLVEWQGPQQTAGVCDLCIIDAVKGEKLA